MNYQPGENQNWAQERGVAIGGPQCQRKEGKHIHCWGKCFSANELPKALQDELVFNKPADRITQEIN